MLEEARPHQLHEAAGVQLLVPGCLYNEASLALCWSTCSWWWRPGLMVEVEGGSGAANPWEGKCWGPRVTARDRPESTQTIPRTILDSRTSNTDTTQSVRNASISPALTLRCLAIFLSPR